MTKAPRNQLPAELVVAAQTGNHTAISSLLAVSQPDIRRYARLSCRSSDVDDAVQDALVLVYRRIGALRVVASFSSWLFEIVRRECRKLARHTFGSHQPLDAIENDIAYSIKPAVELKIDMASAIQSLPPHYRAVILMRDVEELTIEEIIESTCLSREAVKARLHRARGLIREYLKD